jgi:magnesium chelatase family protein
MPDAAGMALMGEAADRLALSARAYYRVLKVARTLADLDGAPTPSRAQVAEALAYRGAVAPRMAA